MTTKETQKYLHVDRKTLYRWRAAFDLPYFVIGGAIRYERTSLDEWMDRFRHAGWGGDDGRGLEAR